ncbi:exopolyphosphatase PRUNE1 [Bactrocera neohumeralis]|uniref:exopolyphosphatase PRUNE1 n=1 Tax=Bactrocera neohumeralis TaxID=98809 RepID=UPI0021654C66|nr:exopolyphosphatase PRUNE1 [Bactrocera neohumeralis]
MLNFLKQSRRFVNSTEPVCIVLGNESCDLDSAVCAVTLAYHYHQQNVASRHTTPNFLPVLNIPRRDYALKTEVNYVFQQHAIGDEHLTFRDDLQEDYLTRSEFILVDHHVSPFASRCLEVFDHRTFDENAQLSNVCKLHIELVGSCATLIAEEVLKSMLTPEAKDTDSETLFTLLRSTIVLDTVNFSESANRATPKDIEICEKLEELLSKPPNSKPLTERTKLFDALVAARADISSLTSMQLLRKDLKILSNGDDSVNIAIPGFPMLVQQFIDKPDAANAVKAFAEETNSAIVILMGMLVENGNVQRDIGLIDFKCNELCKKIGEMLLHSTEPALCLHHYENCNFLNGSFYKMGNIKATRKHVLPLVKQLLDQTPK